MQWLPGHIPCLCYISEVRTTQFSATKIDIFTVEFFKHFPKIWNLGQQHHFNKQGCCQQDATFFNQPLLLSSSSPSPVPIAPSRPLPNQPLTAGPPIGAWPYARFLPFKWQLNFLLLSLFRALSLWKASTGNKLKFKVWHSIALWHLVWHPPIWQKNQHDSHVRRRFLGWTSIFFPCVFNSPPTASNQFFFYVCPSECFVFAPFLLWKQKNWAQAWNDFHGYH